MKSERISPFWVNGYQPFSAGKGTVTARQNHRQGFQVVPDVQGNATHGKVLCHAGVL